jgi:hypothetical protein
MISFELDSDPDPLPLLTIRTFPEFMLLQGRRTVLLLQSQFST